MDHSFLQRSLACVISFCFFLTTSMGDCSREEHSKLFIPLQWGRWNSATQGKNSKVVIISDLHSDPAVQKNISLILRVLEKQGYQTIALEGAEGLVENGFFRTMPDQSVAKQIAQYWLNKGIITGAEYAASFHSNPLRLFGVDDRNLYLASLKVFEQGHRLQPNLLNEINKIHSRLNPDDLKIEALWQDFLEQRLDLYSYIQSLLSLIPSHIYIFYPRCFSLLHSPKELFKTEDLWNEIEILRFIAREAFLDLESLVSSRLGNLLVLLESLVRFEMSRRDWNSYLELKKWCDKNQPLKQGSFTSLFDRFRELFNKVSLFENFYQLSLARDNVLADGVAQWIRQHPQGNLVLVVGGFHVKGILEKLRKQDISLYVVTPQSQQPINFQNHQNMLLGENEDLEKHFKDFALERGIATLAPVPRLSLEPLNGPLTRRAFMAATIALYEIILAKSLKGNSEDLLSLVRQHRILWRERYKVWLAGFLEEEGQEFQDLTDEFDDFEILKIQKKDKRRISAKVRLFGYEAALNVSKDPNETEAANFQIHFIDLEAFQPLYFLFEASPIHAVIRRTLHAHFPSKLKVGLNSVDAVKDYVSVYNRAVELRGALTKDIDWFRKSKAVLSSSDRPALEEFYGALSMKIGNRASFVRLLEKEMQRKGVAVELEIVESDDPSIENRILAAKGTTVLLHPEIRIGDLLFFFPHEMVHVAGGDEFTARLQDVSLIGFVKGLAQILRKISKNREVKDREYLTHKADLLELEALDWELDLHTARLERLPEGQAFLKRQRLGRLEDARPEILEDMSRTVSGKIPPLDIEKEIPHFWKVLSDKSRPLLEKRKRFDVRLAKILIEKSMENSIQAYRTTRHEHFESKAAQKDVANVDDKKLKEKTRWGVSKGFFYVLVAAVLFGITPIIGKDLIEKFPTFSVLLIRDLVVAILLTPFIISKKIPNPTWKQVFVISLLGFFMTGLGDPLYYEGLRLTSPLAAFMIYSTAHLSLMTLASRFIFKEKLTLPKWIGASLTFLGALLIAFGESAVTQGSLWGSILIFGSAVVVAIWTILAKNILKNVHPIILIAITFWAGVPILLGLSRGDFSPISSPMIWIYAGITTLGYVLYYKGLKWISTLTASLLDLTSPMFTALFSAVQKLRFPSLSEVGSLLLTTVGVLTFISGSLKKKPSKRKVLEDQKYEWWRFGKDVAEHLETYIMAGDGITIPALVDLSELEEDYGEADILEALSFYMHQRDVPDANVFDFIFNKLGSDRAFKFLLDAKEDIEEYLKQELSQQEREEEIEVLQTVEKELKRRFLIILDSKSKAESRDSREYFSRAA